MKTIRDTLLKQQNYIIQKYNAGVSTVKLGKEFNCNSGMIWELLDKAGIKIRKRRNYGEVNNKKDDIILMYNSGMSCYKIAKQLGVSKCQVLRILKKNNIDTSRDKTNYHSIKLVDLTDEIIKAFNGGESCAAIAKRLGYSDSNVWKLLKKNGIDVRDSFYSVNEHFFDMLDNEHSCYVYGLWLADGCVDIRGKLRLSMIDKEHIEKIKCIMEYEGPILCTKSRKKTHKDQYCLSINRKPLADQLINKGCVPNKSLTLKFPDTNTYDAKYLSAIVRGYWDGDGHISSSAVSCIGSCYFIDGIANILDNMEISYNIHGVSNPENDVTKQLNIIGKTENGRLKFLDWLYADSTIHLDRKYQKYLELKSKYPAESTGV